MPDTSLSAWPTGTRRLEDLAAAVPSDLRAACELANATAYDLFGGRDSCVLTSHALAAFLCEAQGRDATLTRIEAHIFPQCRCTTDCHGRYCTCRSLGGDSTGSRRPAAGPGYWHGHLAVTCDGFLLDPTIDQVNSDLIHLAPLVLPLPSGWDDGKSIMLADAENTFVRYNKYHRQVGWKSAPDARPSHWRDVVGLMAEVGSNG